MRGIFLPALMAAALLSGCMSELTDRMDLTNSKLDKADQKMKDTYEEMKKLHEDQKLMGTVENFKSGDQEFIRIRSLLIFLENGNMTETVWQYLGAPYPILSSTVGPIYAYAKNEGAVSFNFRNVSYVYDRTLSHEIAKTGTDEILYRWPIKAVRPEFHEILGLAAEDAVGQVLLLHSAGYKSEADRVANIDRARRVMNAGTTIYGAVNVANFVKETGADLRSRYVGTDFLAKAQAEGYFVKTVAERRWYANYLLKMVSELAMREEMPTLATLVEKRLGLNKTQWSYPSTLP